MCLISFELTNEIALAEFQPVIHRRHLYGRGSSPTLCDSAMRGFVVTASAVQ